MGVTETNQCTQCNREKDSILHNFWECHTAKTFWNEFLDFIRTHCINAQNLTLNCKIVIFGVDDALKSDTVFDFILLYAKFYLYQCKNEKNNAKKPVIETTLRTRIL